jgi:hypothetical protein
VFQDFPFRGRIAMQSKPGRTNPARTEGCAFATGEYLVLPSLSYLNS